jgi:hypothetical protein
MRRLLVFAVFSMVGAGLGYSDAIVSEGEAVTVVFMFAGFMASLVMEHRMDVRFPVLMHAVYVYADSAVGEGVVENVSMTGCAIKTTTPATSGVDLRLELYPPGEAVPIEIQRAVVRWIARDEFGVEFSDIQLHHSERLRHLINHLPHSEAPHRSATVA